MKKNEGMKKHIRKYKVRYWAVNQIEDMNLEDENQDIVGELIDNTGIAGTNIVVDPPEPQIDDDNKKEKSDNEEEEKKYQTNDSAV